MKATAAVIYAAKSTEDERGSIETQLADCRAMAGREGWKVVGEFQDEGFSAFSGNRGPDLEAAKRAAVETAAERGACVLLSQHSDRVARGSGDAPDAADHLVEVVVQLRRRGVTLRTCQDDHFRDDTALLMAAVNGQRNAEDSARKSAAVRSGKDRQMERGERLGGPVNDGLALRVERDADDRVVSRRYVRDPERAPVIERLFALSEKGHGDPAVARLLNGEGHRTRRGRPWTRRAVQAAVLNPIYAGRVARRSRGRVALDEPEVVPAQNVEAIIDPDRYDRIVAARETRDRRGPARGRRGGRPTSRYALARLAVCGRCGGRMYARTSPYKRKDGTHRRTYLCSSVHGGTGECDQPAIDAERVDSAVVAYLDRLFVDFEAWQTELAAARGSRREAAATELDRALAELDRLDALAGKVEADYLRQVERGDEGAAEVASSGLARVRADRRRAERETARATAAVEAAEPPGADELLDAYSDLARAVRGGGGSLGKLNDRLRATFEEFRLDATEDGTVAVLPVLAEVELPKPVTDPAAARLAWEEAGCPEPTPEQVEEWERLSRPTEMVGPDGAAPADLPDGAAALIWATGRERTRPPARRLLVEKRPNAHE